MIETPEHQEWRSRQRLSPSAIIKTALITGAVFFVMSGGGPWTTAGTMNAVMGRQLNAPMWMMIIGHFTLALIYTGIIAAVVYRMKTVMAIVLGFVVGLGLYAANWGFFQTLQVETFSREFMAFFVHAVFSVFSAAIYKAISVPRPTGSPDIDSPNHGHKHA